MANLRGDVKIGGMGDTKELLLFRHAKSSRDDPDLDDFDRPLAERGVKDAPLIGRELIARGWIPQMALVSPAARTTETWKLASAGMNPECNAPGSDVTGEMNPYAGKSCQPSAKAKTSM